MKKSLIVSFIFLCFILTACGDTANDSEQSDGMADKAIEEDSADIISGFGSEQNIEVGEEPEIELKENNDTDEKLDDQLKRKVIYTADLHIEVKSYQQTLQDIQEQVNELEGYIVESNMYEDEDSTSKQGHVRARIPQEKFEDFIDFVEDGSSKVIESSTSGQDVTEEYVDLDSRLTSKRVVEDRLLSFMEDAEKTEDLLQISSDLANVQEEIEEITGRMKYLDDQSDLATVSIHIQEMNTQLSSTGKDDLNTWEQTKEQFMKSINFLISAFSSLFVFFIGNVPVFILIGIIGFIIFFIIRNIKQKNKRKN